MINRVKELIRERSKSVREFAEIIGIKQVTLNQQIVGDRKLSLDVINAILDTFPDISAEWLLRGKGEMLVASSQEKQEDKKEVTPEGYFFEVLIEFMRTVNESLKNIEGNTAVSSERLAEAMKLFAELRKTA